LQPTVGYGTLQVAGMVAATGLLEANAGTTAQVTIGSNCTTTNNAICFGGGINLYNYNNGGSLKTDGEFDAGSLYVIGSLSFATFGQTTFHTPAGANVSTKINIPLFDPGAYGQLIALGLPSTAQATARAITVFDDRSLSGGQPNQPPIGVISPNEGNIFGLSWEGTNTTGYVYVGSGGNISLQSGTNQLALWNSGGAAIFKTASPVTNAFQLVDNNNVGYLQADSANHRLAVGLSTAPAYTLDVGGDTNISSGSVYRIGGSTVLQLLGTNNIFVGGAGANGSVTGTANSAVGSGALQAIGSGYSNSAFGSNDMAANVSGVYNAAFGNSALRYNTSGNYNAVVGAGAASGVSGGSDLTGSAVLGYNAGTNLLTGGNYNTLLGYSAGSNLTTGAHNIVIGDSVNAPSATGNYQLNIGNAIYGNLSNGSVWLKNSTDSATGFQIQSTTNANLFTADTSGYVITIAGTTSQFASLTLTNAHFKSTQTNAPTIGTPTGCGTSPTATMTAGSTDSAGSFTIQTGSGSLGGCATTITFNKAYGAAPKAVILTDTYGGGASSYVNGVTSTTFTAQLKGSVPISTSFQIYYWVVE
jgi:hypothetical protein